jgi:5-methylcytosine-specific restriction endonuclease McrA
MSEIEQGEEYEDEFLARFKPEDLQRIGKRKLGELNAWWKTRLVVLKRDGYRCQNEGCKYNEPESVALGDASRLTVHHKRFRKNGGDHSLENLTVLCESCHMGFHKGKVKLRVNGQQYVHLSKTVLKERMVRYKKQMKEVKQYIKSHRLNEINWELISMIMTWFFDEVGGRSND